MPVLAVCDGCRAEYQLKDDLAGRKVKCKECGSVILVPVVRDAGAGRPPDGRGAGGPFGHDRFLINQKRISISEKYYVYDEAQNPILFVERPAHVMRQVVGAFAAIFVFLAGLAASFAAAIAVEKATSTAVSAVIAIVGSVLSLVGMIALAIRLTPKRHIYVYTDDTKANLLLEVFQDQKVTFIRATYTVRDPNEGVLARLRKNYLYNFFRKRWDAFRPDGTPLVVAREDSLILSLLRRFLGPMLGLLRTNFVMLRPGTTNVIGEFNRKYTLFDRYVLDLTADRGHELDRRVAVALGVLLDTGERR
jgi:predicted Zn finger-like uncharacterized protein